MFVHRQTIFMLQAIMQLCILRFNLDPIVMELLDIKEAVSWL